MIRQVIKCEKCGRDLAEVTGVLSGERKVKSYGFSLRVQRNAFAEDLAWAICPNCQNETPFDASLLKGLDNRQGE